ncbi:glycosyltransferase family 4 protein [Holosporaceae bacterium 'Namur']|nr:glycosyltransferase family 4 protein [Holosporaceae bacterium 'Namur']
MENIPRVLQVLPNLISGGVERGTLEIASALIKNNYQAFVCSWGGGKMINDLKHMGAKHISLPVHSKNPLNIILNIFRLKKVIKENAINIVHARSRAPAWSCYFACKLTGAKFVTTFHGTYTADNHIKKYYNSIMLKGDKVIAISKFIYNHILKTYNILNDKLIIINRGVDQAYFSPSLVNEQRLSSLKQNLKLSNNFLKNKKIIIMPARFTRWKGHLYLLKIFKLLQEENFLCLMVGASESRHKEYLKEVRLCIGKYGLKDKVIITGEVKDMPALYMLADFVISASLKPEAFGRTIIEAQSMGKIIIATKEGGATEESIVDKSTGFHIPNDNEKEASKVILSALKLTQDKYNEITSKALNDVKKNFALQTMCDKTLEVYQTLLAMQ